MSMNPEKKICVFSLSERDIFPPKDMVFAKNWLSTKGENSYYFRNMKPKDGLPPDSIVLFSFDARIFGQAIVKEDVQEVPLEEQKQIKKKGGFPYKHKMFFDPSSIEIFRSNPTKKVIAEKLGMQFAQFFTYLNWNQYQEILRMARRQ